MPALNPDIAVNVSLSPASTTLRDQIAELVSASGLSLLAADADTQRSSGPQLWILDRSADPEAPLPRVHGTPLNAADVILVSESADPTFFDTITQDN